MTLAICEVFPHCATIHSKGPEFGAIEIKSPSSHADTPHLDPFGNSMRSLALLRLVGGKDFWKSVRAASRWCFQDMFWNIDIFTCVLVGSEFP